MEQQPAPPRVVQSERTQLTQNHTSQQTPRRTEQLVAQTPRRNIINDTVPTRTDTETDWPGDTAVPTTQLSPKERRTKRTGNRQNACIITEDSPVLDIEGSDNNSSIPPRSRRRTLPLLHDSPLQPDGEMEADITPTLTPSQNSLSWKQVASIGRQFSVMVHRLPVPHNDISPDHSDVDPDNLLMDLTPTPENKTFRVTRHMNTDRKLVDWELSVWKKVAHSWGFQSVQDTGLFNPGPAD